MKRRLEVRHRLYHAEVDFKRRLHHIFTITGNARAANDDVAPDQTVNFTQALGYDVKRLTVVSLIMGIQNFIVRRDKHELGRGRSGIDAEICLALVFSHVLELQIAPHMPRDKFIVLLARGKERFAHRDVVRPRSRRYPVLYVENILFFGIHRMHRRADRHKTGGVFGKYRVRFVQSERPYERFSEPFQKEKRTAEEEHLALDPAPLRQARHRLINHRLKNRGGNVRLACPLVEKRLNIRFCKHPAARSDRIHPLRRKRQLVHLFRRYVEQSRHLVDKRTRPARAASVHALLGTARDKDNFRVLTAELDRSVRVGIKFANRAERRLHFLHETNSAALGKPQSRGTGDARAELRSELAHLPQFA